MTRLKIQLFVITATENDVIDTHELKQWKKIKITLLEQLIHIKS